MAISLFQPKTCMFCSRNACDDGLPVCRFCIHRFHELINERCLRCGKPPVSCECGETETVRFAFYFNSLYSRKIIYNFKYFCDLRTVRFLAEFLVKACGISPEAYDCVTFVPRIKRNINKYGYDQSKLMAKAISEIFGIPFAEALKRNGGRDQKLLSYSQRKKNIKNRYSLAVIPREKYKRVLLVDDVTTTGATVNACAEILKKGFAKSVVTMVLAKTNVPKN